MKPERLSIFSWQAVRSWLSLPTSKSLRTCVVAASLFLFWAVVGFAGYFGIAHYRDYKQLKAENAYLHQKKAELDELYLALRSIRKDENTVRGFLDLDRHSTSGVDSLGQGGKASSEYHPETSQGPSANSELSYLASPHYDSLLDEAKALQERMKDLVQNIRQRRQFINSIPSILPVDADRYWFSSRFGWRRSPFTGKREFHSGLDIIAPARGRIIEEGYDAFQGNYLRIDHGWGCVTTFAHLRSTVVNPDQQVQRGEMIAFMGSTGRSTGAHLHYQIEINGKIVDPFDYIINVKNNPSPEYTLHMGTLSHE